MVPLTAISRLRSGRLPAGPGECAVEPALLDALGLALGDAIVLDTGDGDYADALDDTPRTIVGVVDSPLYISQERGTSTLGNGKAEAFLLLPPSAFDLDTYTEAWLLADGAAGLLCWPTAPPGSSATATATRTCWTASPGAWMPWARPGRGCGRTRSSGRPWGS